MKTKRTIFYIDNLLWSHSLLRGIATLLLVASTVVACYAAYSSFRKAESTSAQSDAYLLNDGEVSFARRLQDNDPEMARIQHDFFSDGKETTPMTVPDLNSNN